MIFDRKSFGFVGMLLGAATFAGMPSADGGAISIIIGGQQKGATIAPNWALGSPQVPGIRGCSDVIGFACVGHFGLGPLSDVLDFSLPGVPVFTEASFSENQRLFVNGLLEAGNESIGDWWNLWIPNARWVGFGANAGIAFFLRDPGDINFGNAIAYVNINNAAHILWASNNSDEATATLPSDFLATLASLGITPTMDNTKNTNVDGSFDNNVAPPPMGMDCTGDSACMPTTDFLAVPGATPEPSTWLLCGAGLLLLAGYQQRRRAKK